MNLNKTLPILFSCTIFMTLSLFIQISNAQNSPSDYVNSHNPARAAVGVANIRWDAGLADYAQRYANQRKGDCVLRHSGGPYGENLAAGSGDFMTGKEAVRLWVDEKKYYHYDSNSCDPGKACGHYTQVVWRRSVRVGCARVRCDNGWFFVICNYDPPGNVIGQKPY